MCVKSRRNKVKKWWCTYKYDVTITNNEGYTYPTKPVKFEKRIEKPKIQEVERYIVSTYKNVKNIDIVEKGVDEYERDR